MNVDIGMDVHTPKDIDGHLYERHFGGGTELHHGNELYGLVD